MMIAKRIILTAALAIVFCAVGGGQDDAVFSVSEQKGTSRVYSDNVAVNDGEKIALVWTTNDVSFSGFRCDGALVDSTNSAILFVLSARRGKIPPTVVQIDRTWVDSGTLSLHLLDTRVKNVHSGEYEFNPTNYAIRAYATLADSYRWGSQFEKMPLTTTTTTTNTYVVAAGYVEPETLVSEPEPSEPETNVVDVVSDGSDVDSTIENSATNSTEVVDGGDGSNARIVDDSSTKTENSEGLVNGGAKNRKPISRPVSGYLPLKITKTLVKRKWKSMYRKHWLENMNEVYRCSRVKTKSVNGIYYILVCDVYSIVPDSYMDVWRRRRYINKFSEHWVVKYAYAIGKTDAVLYEIYEDYGMIEIDRIVFPRKKRSKVRSMLLKSVKRNVLMDCGR